MRRALFLAVGFATLVSACALTQRQPVEMRTRFSGPDHEAFLGSGTGSISGQGFLRQRGGGIVTCAGSKVLMFPASPFFAEFVEHFRAGRRPAAVEQVSGTYRSVLKESQCDAQGNFAFSALPTGSWFIVTEVNWAVGDNRQGGALLRQVYVSSGQSQQVLLSDADFAGR